ncbi:MAG: hypothetical protein MI976_19975 [Pseudomonadales bacterium]|nr:hypothetical protein [Pseudomonadales bacterium]
MTTDIKAIEQALETIIDQHFAEVRRQVPSFYRSHIASFRSILSRHWRHKKDAPREFMHVPLKVYQWGRRKVTGSEVIDTEVTLGKDAELTQLVLNDLLQVPLLEAKIQTHLASNIEHYKAYQNELESTLQRYGEAQVMAALDSHLNHLFIPRDGGRELFMFLMLGLVGKTLSTQVTFGSAVGLGGALAASVYTSQQSWLGAIWIKLTGVPGWVTVGGASAGFAMALLATPLVSPLSELLVNRIRGEKFFHQVVDQFQLDLNTAKSDRLNFAGHVACYVQALPEIIQVLRMIR